MSYYEESRRSPTVRSNRYRNCILLKDKDTGETLLSTRDIDEIPESPSDLFHELQINEVGRLDLLAHTYYKNALYWWVIAQANNIYDPIADTYPGMQVRIPAMETLYGYKGILL